LRDRYHPAARLRKQEQNPADAGAILTARTLGLAYVEENRLEEASNEFVKLIRLAPEEPSGYANLGLVYLRLGRYARPSVKLSGQ